MLSPTRPLLQRPRPGTWRGRAGGARSGGEEPPVFCTHAPLSRRHAQLKASGRERGEGEETALIPRGRVPSASLDRPRFRDSSNNYASPACGESRPQGQGPPARAGHCPTWSSRILDAERPPPRSLLAPCPFAPERHPAWEAVPGSYESGPGPSRTLLAQHDLSTAPRSPLRKARPLPASSRPGTLTSKCPDGGRAKDGQPRCPVLLST